MKGRKSYVFGNFDSKRKYQRRQKQIIQILKPKKINSQATQNNHYKTSNLSVPFGYKLWKMVVKKTYKYRGKQKKNTFRTSRKAKTNCAQKLTLE